MTAGVDSDRIVAMSAEGIKLARTCDAIITASADAITKASLRIGWYGMLLQKHDLFRELGFPCEEAYYRARHIGRSTWYRAIGIARRLEHLGREAVLAMKVENARMLAEFAEEGEIDQDLIQSASSAPIKDFSRKISLVASHAKLGSINTRHTSFELECSGNELREIKAILKSLGGVKADVLLAVLRAAKKRAA
jgi:hypothetical protein